MNATTWPIGTRKTVRVHRVRAFHHEGREIRTVFVVEEGGCLSTVLAGKNWPGARVGDVGTIIFQPSDWLIGRWVFEQQPQPTPTQNTAEYGR